MIYIAEREIKWSEKLIFVFLEKPLYEDCLARIKEQIGEKRSTVGIHRNGNCLLKGRDISKQEMLMYVPSQGRVGHLIRSTQLVDDP